MEHFGLIDDSVYLENAIKKITKYKLSGVSQGNNLVIFSETMRNPLNIQLVERTIKEIFL